VSNAANPLISDPVALRAMLAEERAENERLRQIIKELQRHRFGRRAESLPVDQLLLGLEEAEQLEAEGLADEEDTDPVKHAERIRKRRANRGSLPAHLPRVEQIIDVQDKTCPCCRGPLHAMSEDVSERLDIIPAQFRVIVTRRPKYACRACEEVVVQAPAPARLVEGGIPTEATVAHVLVSKYADHLPLYRQAQIYARQGVKTGGLSESGSRGSKLNADPPPYGSNLHAETHLQRCRRCRPVASSAGSVVAARLKHNLPAIGASSYPIGRSPSLQLRTPNAPPPCQLHSERRHASLHCGSPAWTHPSVAPRKQIFRGSLDVGNGVALAELGGCDVDGRREPVQGHGDEYAGLGKSFRYAVSISFTARATSTSSPFGSGC
jgi:transposase